MHTLEHTNSKGNTFNYIPLIEIYNSIDTVKQSKFSYNHLRCQNEPDTDRNTIFSTRRVHCLISIECLDREPKIYKYVNRVDQAKTSNALKALKARRARRSGGRSGLDSPPLDRRRRPWHCVAAALCCDPPSR